MPLPEATCSHLWAVSNQSSVRLCSGGREHRVNCWQEAKRHYGKEGQTLTPQSQPGQPGRPAVPTPGPGPLPAAAFWGAGSERADHVRLRLGAFLPRRRLKPNSQFVFNTVAGEQRKTVLLAAH